jgi:hypothetical protein
MEMMENIDYLDIFVTPPAKKHNFAKRDPALLQSQVIAVDGDISLLDF